MALNSNALITLDEIKDYLAILDLSQDGILEVLINAVSETFENHVGRKFVETTYTSLKIDGSGHSILWLPNWPVVSLSTVKENGSTLVKDTDFKVYDDIGALVKISGVWAEGFQNIEVTYKAGYQLAPKMGFDSGSTEPAIGAILASASGSGKVAAIKIMKGTWVGKDAEGYVEFESITGEFKDDEIINIQGGATDIMTVNEPSGSAYQSTGMPYDLRLVCMKQIAFDWKKYRDKSWGESSKTWPDGSNTTEQSGKLIKEVKETLDRYMRTVL